MRPLVTVEKPAFKNLVKGLSGSYPQCRTTLGNDLLTSKANTMENINKVLSGVKYVCTTADIWTSRNKSYMGVTLHYIERQDLSRKSVMLSCKQIKAAFGLCSKIIKNHYLRVRV